MPPLSLLIKPASGSCNLRCKYCFYADEAENRSFPSLGRMTPHAMCAIADKALAYADGECTFAFQGGEPTLAGLDFYRHLTSHVSACPNPRGVRVRYAFQTNGTLLDDSWARWFAENRVLVGISLDGTKDIHDRYRVDAEGKGTFQRVMASIRLLERYQVEYNVLTVVTAAAARSGQKIYRFFKKSGLDYQQYIECLDPIGEAPGQHEYSLTPERYGVFLKSLFDAWYLDMKAGRYVYNRYFENLLMAIAGQGMESCNLRGFCGPQWVIEADGSTYPCDFYALDQWRLGNILSDSFAAMEARRQELGFVALSKSIPAECRACKWFPLCRNGCRRNRELAGPDASGKNYFCSAYRSFLEYAYPRLVEVFRLLRAQAAGRP